MAKMAIDAESGKESRIIVSQGEVLEYLQGQGVTGFGEMAHAVTVLIDGRMQKVLLLKIFEPGDSLDNLLPYKAKRRLLSEEDVLKIIMRVSKNRKILAG